MRKSIKHLFGLTLGVSLALGLISSASQRAVFLCR